MGELIKMRSSACSKRDIIDLCIHCGIDKSHIMAEVGSYAGESASLFALYAGRIVCVDMWGLPKEDCEYPPSGLAHAEMLFDNVVQDNPHILKVAKRSVHAASYFPDCYFDLVYIDAAHDYLSVKSDLMAWLPKVKAEGYIAGHDYNDLHRDVIKAVNEFCGEPESVFCYWSWCRKVVG